MYVTSSRAGKPAEDRLGVGHLRHASRVHEAAHLDPAHAGVDRPLDQLDLRFRVDDDVFGLQPVAGRHFDDFHAIDLRALILP